jgi:hypothetical protein
MCNMVCSTHTTAFLSLSLALSSRVIITQTSVTGRPTRSRRIYTLTLVSPA